MTRLQYFLVDDVRQLIKAITNNSELADMVISTDGNGFETLGDFANYWAYHINDINKDE